MKKIFSRLVTRSLMGLFFLLGAAIGRADAVIYYPGDDLDPVDYVKSHFSSYKYFAIIDEYWLRNDVRTKPEFNIWCGLEEAYAGAEGLIKQMVCLRYNWAGKSKYTFKPVIYSHTKPPNTAKDICAGNPISVLSGEKIQTEVDFLSNIFSFNRQYNSGEGQWTHNFDYGIDRNVKKIPTPANIRPHLSAADACDFSFAIGRRATMVNGQCTDVSTKAPVFFVVDAPVSMQTNNAMVRVKRPQGKSQFFALSAGQYKPLYGSTGKLFKDNAGWQYKEADTVESYNADGLIQTITQFGQLIYRFEYTYASNGGISIATVRQENSIKNLAIRFKPQTNLVERVETDGKLRVAFDYDAQSRLINAIKPNGEIRRYHYEDPRHPAALTGITDEKGVRYATWRYDEQGRAISSEHAGGTEKVSLTFNPDGSTRVVNALGKATTYFFEDFLGSKRVTKVTGEPTANCVGANQQYTYTAAGQVDTQTDWNGNVTKFNYDNQNREISRTEAFDTAQASTTQTCWHATLNKPVRIIAPKYVELYEYDSNGQALKHTRKPRPQGIFDCGSTF